ncbi:winged helix-turn-helix transcriptional regulator [Rhizobium ruizarguesonis]|uniref:winged helix-turn-helix transcriptional regulator n=1 Tax=Rhizobium ruizarguesonis TaxID=2081791 RepID=UPI001FE1E3C0|nr:helix-turn-helix domain-containing protein [Rhizobium ruizarguesonis]
MSHWRSATGFAGISKKMLIQTLREVEQRGLVHRRVYNVVPSKVEYELTPLGRTFAQPIEMLYQWGEANQPALDQMGQYANTAAAEIRIAND